MIRGVKTELSLSSKSHEGRETQKRQFQPLLPNAFGHLYSLCCSPVWV